MNLILTYKESYTWQNTSATIYWLFECKLLKHESERVILSNALIDILCLDEAKIEFSFPDAQFKINGYQYLPNGRNN